jgi:hypothetical protein
LDKEDAVIRKKSRGHHLPDTNPDKTEHEEDSSSVGLVEVIQFLDHFPQSTAAVIACARKSEAEMWPTLFDVVGSPRDLFDVSFVPLLFVIAKQIIGIPAAELFECRCAGFRSGFQFTGDHTHSGPKCSSSSGKAREAEQ